MKYKSLYQTDIKISLTALGADGFGEEVPYELMDRMIGYYTEQGGNVIDTARLYGGGVSEETIGRWFVQTGKRNHYFLSSKCAHPVQGSFKARLSKEEIYSDVEQSLMALQTDVIDILWLHRDDPSVPVSGIIDTLNQLINEGKVRCIGTSNWTGNRIAQANDYAKKCGLTGFCASQIEFGLGKRNILPDTDPTLLQMNGEEYAFYNKSGITVFAYSPQAKGYFSKLDKGEQLKEKTLLRYGNKENDSVLKRIQGIAERRQVDVGDIVLSYITSQKQFTAAAIIGCKTMEQLKDTLKNVDLELTQQELDELKQF